jgi:hypothetical protein
MSMFVAAMMGSPFWHFALLAAVPGALLSGFALPSHGVLSANPPGLGEALWAIPGSIAALGGSFFYGAHKDKAQRIVRS